MIDIRQSPILLATVRLEGQGGGADKSSARGGAASPTPHFHDFTVPISGTPPIRPQRLRCPTWRRWRGYGRRASCWPPRTWITILEITGYATCAASVSAATCSTIVRIIWRSCGSPIAGACIRAPMAGALVARPKRPPLACLGISRLPPDGSRAAETLPRRF